MKVVRIALTFVIILIMHGILSNEHEIELFFDDKSNGRYDLFRGSKYWQEIFGLWGYEK